MKEDKLGHSHSDVFSHKENVLYPPIKIPTPEGEITIPVVSQRKINKECEEDPENQIVICVSTKMGLQACKCPVPGSTKETCSVCKQEVWMSPATKLSTQTLPPNAMHILCMECMTDKLKNSQPE